MNLSTYVYRYRPKPNNDDALRHRLRELAEQRKCFGSPRLHIMLKREGMVTNHKRTERIYREEGLLLRQKRRRKGAAGARFMMLSPQRTNERWSMDFVTDSIVTGRRFRALAILDECPNTNWLISLNHARSVIEEWRRDYNEVRPHSSLKGATPKEYAVMTAGL